MRQCHDKERSRIMALQMDNLSGLLGIRIIDRIPGVKVREFCQVKEGVDERKD